MLGEGRAGDTDPISSLHYSDLEAVLSKLAGGRQARDSRADDHNMHLCKVQHSEKRLQWWSRPVMCVRSPGPPARDTPFSLAPLLPPPLVAAPFASPHRKRGGLCHMCGSLTVRLLGVRGARIGSP
jgi:hypothetical protein